MKLDRPVEKKGLYGILLVIAAGAILIVGLWPFDFRPKNKVAWLNDQDGLRFEGQAIVYSTVPFIYPVTFSSPSPSVPNPPSFSLEIWLEPGKESYDYTARILSFYDRHGVENMTLSQWKTGLIAQGRIQDRHPERYPKVGVKDALLKGVRRFFTITSGPEGTRIYIDGKLAGNQPGFILLSENEKNTGRLLLGNSPAGSQSWTGCLLGLAIYHRSLTEGQVAESFELWMREKRPFFLKEEGPASFYLFHERSGALACDSAGGRHLNIPSRFEILRKSSLTLPWNDFSWSRSYFTDILVNILGFIPFGFLFSAYLGLRKQPSALRILFISVLSAGVLSFSIELIQAYLPSRASQLSDILMNIFGAFLGGVLYHTYFG